MGRKPKFLDLVEEESGTEHFNVEESGGNDMDWLDEPCIQGQETISTTDHEIRMKKEELRWQEEYNNVENLYLAFLSLPEGTLCTECGNDMACYLCVTCTYQKKWCISCLNRVHGEFSHHKILVNDSKLGLQSLQQNNTEREKTIWIDTFRCNSTVGNTSLVEAIPMGYFGRKADVTNVLFSFEILNLYRQLNLNGAVTASSFVDSVMALQPNVKFPSTVKDDFRNTFIRYRRMLLSLENKFKTNRCIACPREEEQGNLFLSLDGNFRLVRRKRAGKFHIGKTTSRFLIDGAESEQRASNPNESFSQSCDHHFVAGSNDRRNDLNDIKGLFGASCARHDMPMIFSNMYHGERYQSFIRYAYPKLVLEKLGVTPSNERFRKGLGKTFIFYDIACKFGASFGREGFSYCLPKMHSYAHTFQCYRKYHPLYVNGSAFTDGEGCERIWDMLAPFVNLTRCMLPANRADNLEDKIAHFVEQKRLGILAFLKRKESKVFLDLQATQVKFNLLKTTLDEALRLYLLHKEGEAMSDSNQFESNQY